MADLVSQAKGGRTGKIHPATQTFQALRIAVNDELGALTITLPKPWCDKHQISAQEELEVSEHGEVLNIIPPRNVKLPEISIDVKGLTPVLIWRNVVAAYRIGYDEFKVYFDNPTGKKRYSAFSYNTINLSYSNDKNHEPVLNPLEVIQ